MPAQMPPNPENLPQAMIDPFEIDADNSPDKEKQRLELLKLKLELEHLREPWYRRPAYLGVIVPSFLAFGTLMIGIGTGYFRNQSETIQLRTEKADLIAEKFKNEQKALAVEKGNLNWEIESLKERKTALDQESIKNKSVYTIERQKLSEELQKLAMDRSLTVAEAAEKRRQLDEKGKLLDADYAKKKAGFEKELGNLEGVISRLRDDERLRPIREKIKMFQNPDHLSADIAAAEDILKIVKEDSQNTRTYISFLEQTAGDASLQSGTRGFTTFLLYSLTEDEKWKKHLFGLMRQEFPRVDERLWAAFRHPGKDWRHRSVADRVDFIEFLAGLRNFPGGDDAIARRDILNTISVLLPIEVRAGDAQTSRVYFDVVEMSIALSIMSNIREDFRILEEIAPEAFLVLAARLTIANRNDVDLAKYINKRLDNTDFFSDRFLESLNATSLTRIDVTTEEWAQWLQDHKEIESLWLEAGLKRLRHNPTLIKN